MATLRAGRNPAGRREAGDTLLARAKQASTAAIKDRLAAFAKVHAVYVKSDAAVQVAADRARAAQAKVGEADAAHDEAVEVLASAAVGEGAARTAPFAAWKGPTPTALKTGATAAAAKASIKLAAAIAKSKAAGKATKAAATALAKSANGVLALLPAVDEAVAKRGAAIAERDALEAAWEKTLAVVRRAAKAANDDPKNAGLFAALFVEVGSSKPKRSKKPTTPATPAPTS